MQAAKFRRPRLNLVLLLDVSGSMGSPFDEYYYDPTTGEQMQLNETGKGTAGEGVGDMMQSAMSPDD